MTKIISSILLLFPQGVYAQSLNELNDAAVASSIKTLAKAFVQTTNIDQLKAKNIKSLSKMSEAKFRKRYTDIYHILKDIPLDLRIRYGLTSHMSRLEAIKNIERLDKKDLIQFIDQVPDEVVIKHVKIYLKQTAYQIEDHGQIFLHQIDSLWKKMIHKVYSSR